jgi:hypothetical protein
MKTSPTRFSPIKMSIALAVALCGSVLVILSLTIFGAGASATLNPTPQTVSEVVDDGTELTRLGETVGTSGVAVADPVDPTTGEDPTATVAFAALSPDDQAHAREWLETQSLTDACMSDKGFDGYTYYAYWNLAEGAQFPPSWITPLSQSERAAANLAEYGNTGGGADYHWDDAGCWGYAVHMMGNDNKH